MSTTERDASPPMRGAAGSLRDASTAAADEGRRALAMVRRYLVVIADDSSSMLPLPDHGTLTIGRGERADLRFDDALASREHARIALTPVAATLTDLESFNGTFVNGERVSGTVELVSGDLVGIGSANLVFHRGKPRSPSRILALGRFREQASLELDRAADLGCSTSIVALAWEPSATEAAALEALVEARLQGVERATFDSASHAFVMLPGEGAEAAVHWCQGIVANGPTKTSTLRFGIATSPTDGADLDTLLAVARAAARLASPGRWCSGPQATTTLRIDGEEFVIADPAMTQLFALIARVALSDVPVLVYGETGSGKEAAARATHHFASLRKGRFVAVNCAAIPENLLEAELFGYERGAFSGAVTARPGLFEQASGGTLFLDEIGELSSAAQAKLLRILEARRVTRLGDHREREIDVRFVSATHRDLRREVALGRFREDLYFRVAGAVVWIPPLRDRPRELVLLLATFLDRERTKLGRPPVHVTDSALGVLYAHPWPGNVRELRNLADYFAATLDGDELDAADVDARLAGRGPLVPAPTTAKESAFRPIAEELAEIERKRMSEALAAASGNQTRAAQLLSMPLRTFVTKLKAHGLSRSGTSPQPFAAVSPSHSYETSTSPTAGTT